MTVPVTEDKRRSVARGWWVWWSLLPFGLGSWAPVIAGRRDRVGRWTALGVLWAVVALTGFVLSVSRRSGHGSSGHGSLAGVLVLLAWGGGIVTSLEIRGQQRRRDAGSDTGADRPVPSSRADREQVIAQGAAPARPAGEHWPWISLLPVGLGSWAPIVAAARCRVWRWALPGIAGAIATISGFALAVAGARPGVDNQTEMGIGALLMIGAWIGGIGASFAIRPSYDLRRGLPARRAPAWPTPSAASREWSARYALGAFALTFVVVILLLRYVMSIQVGVGVGVLLVDATLLAGLVPLARRRGLAPRDLGLRPTLGVRSLWLVFLALVAYFGLTALWALVFISTSTRHAASALSQTTRPSTIGLVLAVIAMSLSAPVVEEIFFRGLLYRSLRNRLPVAPAALIAGLLFGLVHITGYPLITLPVKAIFGVIACLLYERTGSLLPGIALHSFVDASVIDIALTGNDRVVLIVAGAMIVMILLSAALKVPRVRFESSGSEGRAA